jgi:hypothetical protein
MSATKRHKKHKMMLTSFVPFVPFCGYLPCGVLVGQTNRPRSKAFLNGPTAVNQLILWLAWPLRNAAAGFDIFERKKT